MSFIHLSLIIKVRYQTDNKYRKYFPGYGFLHLQENLEINMVKKNMDTAVNTKIMYGKQIVDTTKNKVLNLQKLVVKKYLKNLQKQLVI